MTRPSNSVRHLSRDATTQLLGLFIEDRNLLEHATAALAREIVYSGRARALEPAALGRQLQARASEARRRFEARAATLRLRHAFQVVRDDLVAELVREATAAEALVVGLGARAAPTRAWRLTALRRLVRAPLRAVLFACEGWETGTDIVATLDRPTETFALERAIELAKRSRSRLRVLLGAAAARDRNASELRVRAFAAAAGVEIRTLVTTADLDSETTLRAARGGRLLVVPRRDESRSMDLTADLVARTMLPLLVVHGSAGTQ